jgi:hypothetical protein
MHASTHRRFVVRIIPNLLCDVPMQGPWCGLKIIGPRRVTMYDS